MSEAVVYEQLAGASSPGSVAGDADLRRLAEVPVEASVEIGRTRMTVGATLELRPGSIVVLDRLAGEPVDLLVNGTPIAQGEVVVVDEQFGLRVTEIVESDDEAVGLEKALAADNGTPDAEEVFVAQEPATALEPADAAPAPVGGGVDGSNIEEPAPS